MKHKIKILLISLIIISCSKEEKITYVGNIDNKVNGEIQITKRGNDIKGIFINLDNNIKINLRGAISGNKLSMQEYTKNNIVTGVFEGEIIDNITYKGSWINPEKTIKRPFIFNLKSSSSSLKKEIVKNNNLAILNLDKKKLNIGLEKRNIFLYKLLDETNLSLKREKNKLNDIKNNTYYSKVKKEKKILKTEKSIKDIKNILNEIRKRISNKQLNKYYPFQKTPEGIVNKFLNSFNNKNFSKFEYILDPYGDYSDGVQMFTLVPILSNIDEFNNRIEDFKVVKFKILNTRIDNGIAYILTNIEKQHGNSEILFTLINRNKIWYLKDISK